jgi:hypothetical protein
MNQLKISKKTLFKYKHYLHLLNVDYHDDMTDKQLLIKLDMWYDFKYLEFEHNPSNHRSITQYMAHFKTYDGIDATIHANIRWTEGGNGENIKKYVRFDDISYFYSLTIDTPDTYLKLNCGISQCLKPDC